MGIGMIFYCQTVDDSAQRGFRPIGRRHKRDQTLRLGVIPLRNVFIPELMVNAEPDSGPL